MISFKNIMRPWAAPTYDMVFDPATVLFGSVTLGHVATAASLVGTAVSAVGAMSGGKNQSRVSEYNARLEERRARRAKEKAALEEGRQRTRLQKLLSSQRAAVASSGLEFEGSPLLVMEETAAEGELDALLIRHSGTEQEATARARAAADRMAGRVAKAQGYVNAGATLLTGWGTAVRNYGPRSTASEGAKP